MTLPKSKCPDCGSIDLGAWHDGESEGGQFCNDCDWEEDAVHDPDYKPTSPPEHVEVP